MMALIKQKINHWFDVYQKYVSIYQEQLQKIKQHKLLREFVLFIAIGFMIGIYLWLSGLIYVGIAGISLDANNISVIIDAIRALFNKPSSDFITCLSLALIIPFIWLAGLYGCFHIRRLDDGKSLRVYGVFTIAILFWLTCADTLAQLSLHHQLALGNPFEYIRYWLFYSGDNAIKKPLVTSLFLGVLPLLVIILMLLKDRVLNLYGDAHWASLSEAKKAGLLVKEGVFLGRKWGRDLMIGGFEHIFGFAPSGSGKTFALAIPNLISWMGSMVCMDIKMELFKLTSAYRAKLGHLCFLLRFIATDGFTHCYNPLDFITTNPLLRLDQIQKIAYTFIPDNPQADSPIWNRSARALLTTLILYVLDTPELPKTLGQVLRLVRQSRDFVSFAEDILDNRADLNAECRAGFNMFLQTNEEARAGILKTFEGYLELFANPLIDAATSRSDFDIRDLRRKKMTIYIGVANDDIDRLAPLISVFYQQVAAAMVSQVPGEDEPYPLLLLIDEFSALGKMDTFVNNIGLFRGFHVRVIMLIQELAHLKHVYGEHAARLFMNVKVRIAFTQNDPDTAKYISTLLGDKTLCVSQTSKSQNTNIESGSSTTESTQYYKRPLMLQQEILRLPKSKAIIITEGNYPVLANKARGDFEEKYKKCFVGEITVPNIFESTQ